MTNFDSILDRAEEKVETFQFVALGREFRENIKQAQGMSRGQQNDLWGRYKSLAERHGKWRDNFVHESKMIRGRIEHELYGIDVDPDGAPGLNSPFSRYERVGEKIHTAREQFKNIQIKIKQAALTKDDRESLRNFANDIWYKIKNTEERLNGTHKVQADQLYNATCDAVESKPIGEARQIFKVNSAEVRSLYLSKDDREKMKSWFDELWKKLSYRQEEASRQWMERNEQQLNKLTEIRDNKERTLERVRENLSNNYDKQYDARGSYRDRLDEWISDGEDKMRQLEDQIDSLNTKIADIEARMRRR